MVLNLYMVVCFQQFLFGGCLVQLAIIMNIIICKLRYSGIRRISNHIIQTFGYLKLLSMKIQYLKVFWSQFQKFSGLGQYELSECKFCKFCTKFFVILVLTFANKKSLSKSRIKKNAWYNVFLRLHKKDILVCQFEFVFSLQYMCYTYICVICTVHVNYGVKKRAYNFTCTYTNLPLFEIWGSCKEVIFQMGGCVCVGVCYYLERKQYACLLNVKQQLNNNYFNDILNCVKLDSQLL
eukprot:TRINITY_DN11384_c0_g3_i2.p1 TRINITY_DN11384_c0_g3~~TRINITY_DN11384_c0_g3_i2.p1  ORF type:complete len:237 (+),score=-3.03 TRINITY_DN11384_c0_g3_i2:267-977(+)